MAERDAGRPLPDTLSSEEADRLSERFRPSWEADPDSQAAPRAAPPPGAKPPPAPPAAGALKPAVTVQIVPEGTATKGKRPSTLVGIHPDIPPPPKAAPDDLDWELPTNPLPAPPPTAPEGQALRPAAGTEVQATKAADQDLMLEVEELHSDAVRPSGPPLDPVHVEVEEPPPSKPSGIGQTYVPKDQNAPPVVLKEDVQAAEAQAQAELEAAHRSRRAPTVVRMKAIPLPPPPGADEPYPIPKRRVGLWLALGAISLLSAAGLVMLLTSRPPARTEAQSPEATKAAQLPTAEPAPPPPPTATDPPASAPTPAESAAAAPLVVPGEPVAPTASASAPVAVTAPKHVPLRSKPAKPAAAPRPPTTAKAPAAPRPASKGVIVRETPF